MQSNGDSKSEGNFFDKVKNNVQETEEKLLGPTYKYYSFVKSPEEMDMDDNGTMGSIADDISGMLGYIQILSAGGGKASKIDRPLGNKFFLETGATCKDKASGELVTRSLYINNQPDGSIPFITTATGVSMPGLKGLVPGTLSNLSQINPMQMFQSFMTGTNPECQAIEMQTIDVNNNIGKKTAFVTTNDIKGMNPCWFEKRTNPVTNSTASMCGFTTMSDSQEYQNYVKKNKKAYMNKKNKPSTDYGTMPNDVAIKLYYSSVGLLLLYIFIRLFQKKD